MSRQQLHDLLVELEQQRNDVDYIDQSHHQLIDQLIESLEQQKLYPQDFDQFSALNSQIKTMTMEYENKHPAFSAVLSSISQVLNNFKV